MRTEWAAEKGNKRQRNKNMKLATMIAAMLAAAASALAMPTNEEIEKAGAEVQARLQKQLEGWLEGNRTDAEVAKVLSAMAEGEKDEASRYVCRQAALAAFARAGDAGSAIRTLDRMRAETKDFTPEIEKSVVDKAVATASSKVAAKIREGSSEDAVARRTRELSELRAEIKKAKNREDKTRLTWMSMLMEKQATCTRAEAEAEYRMMVVKTEAFNEGYEKALSDMAAEKREQEEKEAKLAADNQCAANRKMLEEACEKWRRDTGSKGVPKMSDLVGRAKALRSEPRCLRGGTYKITPSGVVCTHVMAEHQEACLSNINQIETACEQWSLETKKKGVPKMSDLVGPAKYIRREPKCPDGGTYTIARTDSGEFVVTCSHGDDAEFPHKKLPGRK